jgi:ABC-type sugar transport system substrate-binding protein
MESNVVVNKRVTALACALALGTAVATAGVSSATSSTTPGDSGAPTATADPEGTIVIPDLSGYTMGFAQVGAESGWRTANTQSIQAAAEEAGVELIFTDAQGEQENQIESIRQFIQQGVDVIAFSPIVETGWDAALVEARDAGIPVILTDRAIESEEEGLYVTFLGSDFVREGRWAGEWVNEEFADADQVNIVELQGTTGSAPANDRADGFREVVTDPKFEIIASQTGDFTREGGKEVMEAFLQAHDDIDLLYAHNDDMGLGAIEAIEAAGLVPGEDIKIVTVDAVHDGMQALADGKINFIVECNPLLGPQLMDIAGKVLNGEEVPDRIVTIETTFDQDQAIAALPDRQY